MKRRFGALVVMTAAVMAFVSPVAGGTSWGPATPNFNLEVILRPVAVGPDNGFGLVTFRQPKDAEVITYLDVWVRDLAPNHGYDLQRAIGCTGTTWLTLGQGPVPKVITTDEAGTGRAALFRSLAAFPLGTQFAVHFQVIDAVTSAVVLESACYHFTVSQ
jgi:hypothetical protein